MVAAFGLGLVCAPHSSAATVSPDFGNEGFAFGPNSNSGRAFDLIESRSHGVFGTGFSTFKLDSNGNLDTDFGDPKGEASAGYDMRAVSLTEEAGGKILVAGSGGLDWKNARLKRLAADGSIDREFNENAQRALKPIRRESHIFATGLRGPGRIYAVGSIKLPKGRSLGMLIAFGSDGQVDNSFGHNGWVRWRNNRVGYTAMTDVKSLSSGKILVSGVFRNHFRIARYRASGVLDKKFGERGYVDLGTGSNTHGRSAKIGLLLGQITVLRTQFNGKVLFGLTRLNQNGRIDREFGRQGSAVITARNEAKRHQLVDAKDLAVDANGFAYIATENFDPRFEGMLSVRRYTPAGVLDRSFFGDGIGQWAVAQKAETESVTVLREGGVLVGGSAEFNRDRVQAVVLKLEG